MEAEEFTLKRCPNCQSELVINVGDAIREESEECCPECGYRSYRTKPVKSVVHSNTSLLMSSFISLNFK